jgi:hypothetical protein
MKLANQNALNKQKKTEDAKDGWLPVEIGGNQIFIPLGGTCGIEEGLVTLHTGESCTVTIQYRVDTDGRVWKRPVMVR